MKFLILFAQAHPTFRECELSALADLYGIPVDLSDHNEDYPFMVVDLENPDQAQKLIERSILTRGIYELYGVGTDDESLHESIKSNQQVQWEKYKTCSFKFDIISYQGARSKKEQVKLFESLDYLPLEGPIRMKKQDEIFTILEDYEHYGIKAPPRKLWFGRYVGSGSRHLVETYDLSYRKYIGTTSFDAQLSLVTCNIAQTNPGKFMYDPFAGTGSFLIAGSQFGALTIGSDIDPRMLRGKGEGANVEANFKQYKLTNKFLDLMTMDFTHNAFRPGLKLDAIVCDPPYGVREGLKVLGAKDPERIRAREHITIDGEAAYLRDDYIHPKKPYQFNSLLDDLLNFGAERLVDHGRLCFWMPTANDDFSEPNDIPLHPDLKLVGNCVQEFNKWSRRLLVYVKRGVNDARGEQYAVSGKAAEEFRDKYFRSFRQI